MATGFPTKANWVSGDILTAAQMDDLAGTVNLLNPTAKGGLVSASAANTPGVLAVGADGQTLVADASTSTGLRWQGSAIGKNCVFNSGYDIFQRATTPTTGLTTTGGIAYTLDRWVSWTQAAGGSVITSQQATGDTTNLPFVRYCARFRRATSNTDTGILVLGQVLENTDSARFIGQTVTFSFYARKGANYSATSSALSAVLYSNTTTDASYNTLYTGAASPVTVNATLTTTWQRFQGTGTISASATQISFGFNFTPTGTAGAADYFEVTGVQVELGSIATPFSRTGTTLQGELAAAQRYYWRQTADATATTANFGVGVAANTTLAQIVPKNPVVFRVTPTSVDYSTCQLNDGVSTSAITSLVLVSGASNASSPVINCTVASGLTAFRPYLLGSNSSASGYLGFSAEL